MRQDARGGGHWQRWAGERLRGPCSDGYSTMRQQGSGHAARMRVRGGRGVGSATPAANLLRRRCSRAGSERPRTSARRGAQRSRVGRTFWTVDCARALLEPRQRERQLGLGELKGGGVRASSSTCACEAGRPSQSQVSAHDGPGLSVLACESRCAWSWNQPPSATSQEAGAGSCWDAFSMHGTAQRLRRPAGRA